MNTTTPKITAERVDRLLESYRMQPSNVSRAAVSAEVTRKTARRAWNTGWPSAGIPPMKETVHREQVAARAALLEVEQERVRARAEAEADRAWREAERAREDIVRARKAEAELVRAERGNILALIGVTSRVLRGAVKRAADLERLVAEGKDVDGRPLTVKEQIDVLWKLSRVMRQASEAAAVVFKLERVLLAEPTEIVGTVDLESMSAAEMIADIQRAFEAAMRIKQEHGIVVGDDGNGRTDGGIRFAFL